MSPRRSTRPRNTRDYADDGDPSAEANEHTHSVPGDADDEHDFAPPPKRMKHTGEGRQAAPSAGKGKGRKKKSLARFQDAPLEVLFMTFSFLPPLDLLRLSRTTKTFRTLLLSHSNRPVWVEALASVPNLPPCPSDLSEPAYANLAFDTTCHMCPATNIMNVLWSLRLRLCSKCFKLNVETRMLLSMSSMCGGNISFDEALSLVPWHHGFGKHSDDVFCLTDNLVKVLDRLEEFPTPSPERDDLTGTMKTDAMEIVDHGQACEAWQQEYQMNRTQDLDLTRLRRRAAIEAKLIEAGFADELEWLAIDASGQQMLLDRFVEMKQVKQAKDLTPRMWSNMREDLTSFMEAIRVYRHANCWIIMMILRLQQLTRMVAALTPAGTTPRRIVDLLKLKPLNDLMESPWMDEKADHVTPELMFEVLGDFDAAVAQCRDQQTQDMLVALSATTANVADPSAHTSMQNTLAAPANLAKLDLATSIFTCTHCRHNNVSYWSSTFALSHIQALEHRCRYSARTDDLMEHNWASPPETYLRIARQFVEGTGGDGDIVFCERASLRAADLVRMCGLNPATATFEEMDRLDARFLCSCNDCVYSGRARVMHWRHMVVHPRDARVYVADSAEEAAAKQMEAEMAGKLPNDSYTNERVFRCLRCPAESTVDQRLHLAEVLGHLLTVHVDTNPRDRVSFAHVEGHCFAKPARVVNIELEAEDDLPDYAHYR